MVIKHLKLLKTELVRYFPELQIVPFTLARNRFLLKAAVVPDDIQNEFIDLITNGLLQDEFKNQSVNNFWVKNWKFIYNWLAKLFVY